MPHYGLAGVMTAEKETVNARPLNPADFDLALLHSHPQLLTAGACQSIVVAQKTREKKKAAAAATKKKKKELSVEPPVTAADAESPRAVGRQVPGFGSSR